MNEVFILEQFEKWARHRSIDVGTKAARDAYIKTADQVKSLAGAVAEARRVSPDLVRKFGF
jgi:hypothetical protein